MFRNATLRARTAAACETRSAPCQVELPTEGQYEIFRGAEQAFVALPLEGPLEVFAGRPSPWCDSLFEGLQATALEQDAGP